MLLKVLHNVLNGALCVCLIPLFLVLGPLCLLITFIPIFSTRTGLSNLRLRMHYSPMQAHFALCRVFLNYVSYFTEITIFQMCRANLYTNFSAFEKFLGTLSAELPLVVLGAHLGNIEAAGRAVSLGLKSQHNKQFFVLAKPAKFVILTKLETWIRKWHNLQVIQNDRRDLLKCMIGTLKNHDALGLLIDQKPHSGGPFFEFFGQMSAFPIAGIELGVRQQAQFIFVSVKRVCLGRFEILFDVVQIVQPDVEDESHKQLPANTIMERYIKKLEIHIKNNPSQWFWDYKKWSRQPTV